MSKDYLELASDITVAWLTALGQSAGNSGPPTAITNILTDKDKIAEFYKTIRDAIIPKSE